MRKVCVVTGSRAEYGLLQPLLDQLERAPDFELQLIVTGAHLSPEFGQTGRIIEEDGFRVDERIEMLVSSDTPKGVAKSIGLGLIGFADALDRLKPDLMVLLGDRYEILAAAQAALVACIPIAHVAGGDLTEGAIDDVIRHCLTKMSHLHFVTNRDSATRVIQMGENPARVHVVGSLGIDRIMRMSFLSREELSHILPFRFRDRNLLVTFHPETLSPEKPEAQFEELLAALDSLDMDVGLIFTGPNADPGGRKIQEMIDTFVSKKSNAKCFLSLGNLKYLNVINQVDAVIGNSSSGLYEVPSCKKPTIDIGDRQRGRIAASSVIRCPARAAAIREAILQAFRMDCSRVTNPYGDGNAADRILEVLRGELDWQGLLRKQFHEMDIHP